MSERAYSRLEQLYRRELWFNHGHDGLYGDDGEMQCGQCRCDYKRDPLYEVESAADLARMQRMSRAVEHDRKMALEDAMKLLRAVQRKHLRKCTCRLCGFIRAYDEKDK